MKYLVYDTTSTEELKNMDPMNLMGLLTNISKEPTVKCYQNLISAYPEMADASEDLSGYTTNTLSRNVLYQNSKLIFNCTKAVYSESTFGDYTITIGGKTMQSGNKNQITNETIRYQDTLTVAINYSGADFTYFSPRFVSYTSLENPYTLVLPEELYSLLASDSGLSNITVNGDGTFSGITEDNVAILSDNGYYAETGWTSIYPIFRTGTFTFDLSKKFNGQSILWFFLQI